MPQSKEADPQNSKSKKGAASRSAPGRTVSGMSLEMYLDINPALTGELFLKIVLGMSGDSQNPGGDDIHSWL